MSSSSTPAFLTAETNLDMTAGQSRKAERDKHRKRRGNVHRKRWHVLNNAQKVAFKGWVDEPEPWSLATCEEFIEWCHIDKKFPPTRHYFHRHTNKANLKYCMCSEFRQRCIEVYQFLYNVPIVERNEVSLFVARGAYAEVALKKEVDWTTIKTTPYLDKPSIGKIPRGVLKFPEGGLGIMRTAPRGDDVVGNDTETSEEDLDSDGSRPHKPMRVAEHVDLSAPNNEEPDQGEPRARLKRTKRPKKVPRAMLRPAPPSRGSNSALSDDRASHEFDFPADDVPSSTTVVPSSSQAMQPVEDVKDKMIAQLESELSKLRSQYEEKCKTVREQEEEIVRLRELSRHTITLSDVNEGLDIRNSQSLDRVVLAATYGIVEDSPVPKRQRVSLNGAFGTTSLVPQAIPETQDSLSFSPISPPPPSNELALVRAENEVLNLQLAKLGSIFYHWKVACILSVDRGRQVASELEKIDHGFTANMGRREFQLTSWACMDSMFPNDLPTKAGVGVEGVDWAKLGWDYENARSAHTVEDLRQLLWPKPAQFVLDNTACPICVEPFGPEGGWALGSCQHKYHPQCLLLHCLCKRRCVICKAPFHDRLYEMFNLKTYMPPSWEHTSDTCDDPSMWGKDLAWNWRQGTHDLNKSDVSSHLIWETDPNEILRVAPHLAGSGPQNEGRRMFFFQCLGGYFDNATTTFKWGPHPLGHRWNEDGRKITNEEGVASQEDLEMCAFAESSWGPSYKSQALDYLMDRHSPNTERVLKALRDSNILESIMHADGPARRTRAKRKLLVGESSNAGPSNSNVVLRN